MTQQVTHKVTQHLTSVSYGENVKLLSSMIQVRRLFKKKNQKIEGRLKNRSACLTELVLKVRKDTESGRCAATEYPASSRNSWVWFREILLLKLA